MKRTILETKIEEHLVDRVNAIGGMCLKMVPTFCGGLPDRLALYKGKSYFVEVKAPGETPRKLQVTFAKELGRAGFDVTVIDTRSGVSEFIAKLIREAEC